MGGVKRLPAQHQRVGVLWRGDSGEPIDEKPSAAA